MKVKKFRIKNYKSIVDSGDCYLTDTITILAGKNESGKTAILEALEDFNVGVSIREKAKPVQYSRKKPEISVTFTIEEEVVKYILDRVKAPESLKLKREIEFEIVKKFPNKYSIGEDTLRSGIFDTPKAKQSQTLLKKKWGLIKHFINVANLNDLPGMDLLEEVDFSDFDETMERLEKLRKTAKSDDFNARQISARARRTFLMGLQLDDFTDFLGRDLSSSDFVKNNVDALVFLLKSVAEIETELRNMDDLNNSSQKFIADFFEYLKKYIPHFSMVSSSDDTFPNRVSFRALENDEWVEDLSVKYGLDVSTIRSSVDRIKRKHKRDVNNKLNKEYELSWSQDSSTLVIDWDSEFVYFWIEENGDSYEPSLRSSGRQWHLAFHTKVSAYAKFEGKVPNVILIDEPGIFLHAKAQRDILKTMEFAAERVQLIFSTHSPYLLEADKLNRVRLVLKSDDEGTKICDKAHAKADKETLTPIMTAMGFELNSGIAGFEKRNNVVVEGASDVYYFNAFKKLLEKDDINFIFGGGTGNMPSIGMILRGWGARVIYLCDNDEGGKNGAKNLKRNWRVDEKDILYILKTKGSVEDIFSKDDFIEIVLKNDESITYTGSNSEYVKDSEFDKVLVAKLFFDACERDDGSFRLDNESMGRVEQLFKRIEDRFKG